LALFTRNRANYFDYHLCEMFFTARTVRRLHTTLTPNEQILLAVLGYCTYVLSNRASYLVEMLFYDGNDDDDDDC
jgi:hypothetical protein